MMYKALLIFASVNYQVMVNGFLFYTDFPAIFLADPVLQGSTKSYKLSQGSRKYDHGSRIYALPIVAIEIQILLRILLN